MTILCRFQTQVKIIARKKNVVEKLVPLTLVCRKQLGLKVDIDGRKLESSSKFDTSEGTSASGVNIDQWPRLSLSTAAKTDQDSFDTSMPNSSSDITTLDSSAGGKEQGDFVDYGWASIGSFDDLDRIFSNGDPIFGNVNLGDGDDLWKMTSCVALGYGKMNDPASRGLKNTQTELAIVGKSTATNSQLTAENVALPNELTNKFYRQKKLLKGRKKAGRKSQQKQLQGPEQLQYPQLSNPFVFPSAYRNMKNPYSMTVLSHMQSGEFKHQPLASAL
ncbi:PROTEIN LNK1 [Salix koriyanagi]|uniref:PROTEIN LNK1 n=1 Tax=Salix koriyanagi TaxID=2511006 RepID=A0A9Q0Q9F5_9ROSI|nr:PROTEIN LNK1 [Salix koriyanagi]